MLYYYYLIIIEIFNYNLSICDGKYSVLINVYENKWNNISGKIFIYVEGFKVFNYRSIIELS